ncbi:MAG: alpha/beta hydrolase [Acidobacteria bacterium]|jgi:pimeloyl-ACP methyl ester carboxylesterase|nr:alpha/beta hydrolase [Acidobacteriota bacterium]
MSYIRTKNFNLYFESNGTGEPLVLIPGFASGAWSWFKQTEELSKDFRVVTFDPYGVGKSKSPNNRGKGNSSLEVFAEDVLGLLDALEIEKAHIVGASFGGFVAQEFALKFPERLNKLVLVCTTAGGANHVRPSIEVLRSFAPDASLTRGEHIRRFLRPAFSEEFNVDRADEVERVCRMREESDVSETTYFDQLETAFNFDLENKIRSIKAETLVLTGDKDLIVPMQNSVNLSNSIPNAVLKIVKNGSHLFFIEKADEFNQIVSEFLRI